MPDWTERDIDLATGVRLHILEAGAGPLVILLHGFPELGYSWRHQLPALAAAGYHVVAPDQRGYGGSSRPKPIEAYDLDSLAWDVVGLIDALGEEKAVVIGHDWGAPVAWHTALRHSRRLRGVGSLSVPHAGRGPRLPTELMRENAGPDHIFYVDYFQQPGLVDAEFASDTRGNLLAFMWSIAGEVPPDERFKPIRRGNRFLDSIVQPKELPAWLTAEDLDVYTRNFEATGFTGGLNWYRNVDRNWQKAADLAGAKVTLPAMFVTGTHDPARNPAAIERLREVVPDLRVFALLDGCGHWTQQERPAEVNAHIIEFLGQLDTA